MRVRILPGGVVETTVRTSGGDDDGTEWESIGTRHYFALAKEMTAAMKKPEYKTSKSYRDLVKAMIGQSLVSPIRPMISTTRAGSTPNRVSESASPNHLSFPSSLCVPNHS